MTAAAILRATSMKRRRQSQRTGPVERRDAANTAQIDATIPAGADVERNVQSSRNQTQGGAQTTSGATSDSCDNSGEAIETTPIVGDARLIVSTRAGRVHALNFDGSEIVLDNEINLGDAVNTPLVGADDSIFVTAATGATRRYSGETGALLFSASLLDNIETPPILGPNGILYSGTISGLFAGVCTNGAFRFTSSLGSITATTAVVPHPNDSERNIVITAAGNGRVQAFEDRDGDILWSFFASAPIRRSAVVVDVSNELFFAADTAGFIFAASLTTGQMLDLEGRDLVPYQVRRCVPTGEICDSETECGMGSCVGEEIATSPALGSDRLYVATGGASNIAGESTSGAIHALSLDFDGGAPDWSWVLPEGGTFLSSPVVVSEGDREVVIAGADLDVCRGSAPASDCVCDENGCDADVRGQVLAIADGAVLWSIELPDAVGTSSPSIRQTSDGLAIYIGTASGKLFEIDWRASS